MPNHAPRIAPVSWDETTTDPQDPDGGTRSGSDSDRYVDPSLALRFKAEYKQLQTQSRAETFADSKSKGGAATKEHLVGLSWHRPKRSTARVNINYYEPALCTDSDSGPTPSEVRPTSCPSMAATHINSQRERRAPRLAPSDDMRAHNAASPVRRTNNIVEEYLSPNDAYVEDYQTFKTLSDAEKVDVIRREAEEHGMEKPRGYNVSFHYNPHVEYHHFGSSHPMKPWRLTLTKQLIVAYGLEYTMDLYEPRPASYEELTVFHDREYTSFLSQ